MECEILSPVLLAFGLYVNTLQADFAYDDSRAILKNPDILPEVPLSNLFLNDFWGTPLNHSGSHKSYRPLCVLSFRLNYLINGLSPRGYHLGNAVLHAVVTGFFVVMVRTLLPSNRKDLNADRKSRVPLASGLLFASHPIHTEAVAGVVGRADLLASLFFLLAFLSYVRYCGLRQQFFGSSMDLLCNENGSSSQRSRVQSRSKTTPFQLHGRRSLPLFGCFVFTAAAMLSKEQGVTVIAVCATYDVLVQENVRPNQLFHLHQVRYRGLREGLMFLLSTTIVLISARVHLMGLKPPEFSPSDNPASDSDSLLTRTLTFGHLPCLNFLLLLYPRYLNFDWSMGAIRLIESLLDYRNLFSLVFYSLLFIAFCRLVHSLNSVIKYSQENGVKFTPKVHDFGVNEKRLNGPVTQLNHFLLAKSNLHRSNSRNGTNHDYEHAEYLQTSFASNGYKRTRSHQELTTEHQINSKLLLIGLCFLVFPFVPATNLFFYVGFVIAERVLYLPSMGYSLLVAQGAEVLYSRCRSHTWKRVIVTSAGIWLIATYSLRTITRNLDWKTEESLYRSGIAINPAKAWGNLANVFYSKGRIVEAEEAYKSALSHRGNMADVHYNLGILYQEQSRYNEAVNSYRLAIQFRPRLTMAHLNLGIVYSAIGRKDEAKLIYRHCAEIDTNGLKDPRLHDQTKVSALYNLGRLLADEEKHQEAIDVYLEAVNRRPPHYQPQSLYNMLGESFAKLDQLEKAEFYYKMALKAKPDHIPAHLTMAKLHHRQGLIESAEEWFKKGILLDPNDPSVYHHYGQFLGEVGRHIESSESFLKAATLAPDDFEVIFAAANSLRQAGMNSDAEKYYRQAVRLKPSMVIAHMNLGAMLHYNGKLKEAELSYEMALRLKPNDVITTTNLNKLRSLIDKQKS